MGCPFAIKDILGYPDLLDIPNFVWDNSIRTIFIQSYTILIPLVQIPLAILMPLEQIPLEESVPVG